MNLPPLQPEMRPIPLCRCLSVCLAAVTFCTAMNVRASDGADPEFPLIGKIRPRSAKEIASSSWSIGGETMDRDYAVYAHYRKYLGPLGAKGIRLQAGWQKCEKSPGGYDFAWLDQIVDDARAQGVQPWLETSYGNTNYPGGGGTGLGGGLPTSLEALAAWDRWVKALVARFKDRVNEWEVWNEPDLGKTNRPEDYAALFIRTAELIRSEQPDARIYALGLAGNATFLEKFLDAVKTRGKLGLITAITVHGYPKNPDDVSLVQKARQLAARYSPSIEIRQGETGAPSTAATFGALSGHAWTERTQAKWNLRRLLAHRAIDAPMNLFTLMELHYTDRLNTKGLLKARPDKTVEREKPAYFAAQRVFAIYDDRMERLADYPCATSITNRLSVLACRDRNLRGQIVAVWLNEGMPGDANAVTPTDLTFARGEFKDPVLVDLLTGEVRAIPKGNWRQTSGGCLFRGIPLYDSPTLIAERNTLPL